MFVFSFYYGMPVLSLIYQGCALKRSSDYIEIENDYNDGYCDDRLIDVID